MRHSTSFHANINIIPTLNGYRGPNNILNVRHFALGALKRCHRAPGARKVRQCEDESRRVRPAQDVGV